VEGGRCGERVVCTERKDSFVLLWVYPTLISSPIFLTLFLLPSFPSSFFLPQVPEDDIRRGWAGDLCGGAAEDVSERTFPRENVCTEARGRSTSGGSRGSSGGSSRDGGGDGIALLLPVLSGAVLSFVCDFPPGVPAEAEEAEAAESRCIRERTEWRGGVCQFQ
jgi:hypothetical protein